MARCWHVPQAYSLQVAGAIQEEIRDNTMRRRQQRDANRSEALQLPAREQGTAVYRRPLPIVGRKGLADD
jgi:hypothetical protein